jgi:hypothetical protein
MAKVGEFRCKTCGGGFGMAAHLGRPMSTVRPRLGRKVRRAGMKPTPQRPGVPVLDVMARVLREFKARRAE